MCATFRYDTEEQAVTNCIEGNIKFKVESIVIEQPGLN